MSRLRAWLPVVVWGCVMFSFSTDTFSSSNTSHYIPRILHFLLPFASAHTIELLHALVRKCGHVFEYFVFGLLLFRAFRATTHGGATRWALNALAIAAIFAASDEFHQTFVPSRGASIWDVLLDTAAAALAVVLAWVITQRYSAGAHNAKRANATTG
jgi:VanZ family protein